MNDDLIQRCVRCGAWVYAESKCEPCRRGIVYGVFSPEGGLTMVYRRKDQAQRACAILDGKEGNTGDHWYIEEVYEKEIKWERSTPRLRS